MEAVRRRRPEDRQPNLDPRAVERRTKRASNGGTPATASRCAQRAKVGCEFMVGVGTAKAFLSFEAITATVVYYWV